MLNRKRNERSNTSHETSLIARGTVIRGDLRFSGALHLDGRIEGTVFAEGEDAMLTLSRARPGAGRDPRAACGDQRPRHRRCSHQRPAGTGGAGTHRWRPALSQLEMAAGAQVNGRISRQAEDTPRELPAPEVAATDLLDDAMPA